MCGIIAYLGYREALPILINGLKRLEYRGYDSAGIALLQENLHVYKKKGKVAELEAFLKTQENLQATIGMGHTRWATHGEPNDENAHPHYSASSNLALIHNGIVENYAILKKKLLAKGHTFSSETDSEILIHFIEDVQLQHQCSLEEAVRLALLKTVGAYAIVILSKNDPNQIIAARKGSPLVIGIGEKEFFLASDSTPILEHTDKVVYLNDSEIAVIHDGNLTIKTLKDSPITPQIQTMEMDSDAIEKNGYEHFMLKEIMEQPKSIRDCMRGRLIASKGILQLGGLHAYMDTLITAERIIIVACGTSWHAGLVAEYLFEDLARIPVEVEYASEFRYRNPVIKKGDIILVISQSGETADTLAAIELAKSCGALVFGVCNVVGSSIARATDAGVYLHAGPEIGVASTKAFTAQVSVLAMMAILLGYKKKSIEEKRYNKLLYDLDKIPDQVEKILKLNEKIKVLAAIFKESRNFLYLGRGYNFPVALEGALKLKEISYIHAEGYPAAEMKHGPIALIDEHMPVLVIALKDTSYDKIVSNIQEVKARKGRVIAIVTEGDYSIPKMAEFVIEVPATDEVLTPLLSVIPLQLLSYYIAVMRGCDVDQPRNLAKSVTVE